MGHGRDLEWGRAGSPPGGPCVRCPAGTPPLSPRCGINQGGVVRGHSRVRGLRDCAVPRLPCPPVVGLVSPPRCNRRGTARCVCSGDPTLPQHPRDVPWRVVSGGSADSGWVIPPPGAEVGWGDRAPAARCEVEVQPCPTPSSGCGDAPGTPTAGPQGSLVVGGCQLRCSLLGMMWQGMIVPPRPRG